jgi:hypothetical protein
LKFIKLYCILITCLYSNNLFSQPITHKDLVGTWISGLGDTVVIFTMTNDSIYIRLIGSPQKLIGTYSLKDSQNVSFLNLKSSTATGYPNYSTFKILRISTDEYSMTLVRESMFFKDMNSWIDTELSEEDRKPVPLKRKK